MNLLKVESITGSKTIIVPVYTTINILLSYVDDKTLAGIVSKNWEEDKSAQITPIFNQGRWIIPINCLKLKSFEKLKKEFQKIAHAWTTAWGTDISIDLQDSNLDQSDAILNGLITGTYQIGKYKSTDIPTSKLQNIDVYNKELSSEQLKSILGIAETQMQIMDLMNGPANISNIKKIISWAQKSGSTHGYDVTVLDTAQLESLGMGSLLAVGKAAVTKSHMLVMEYKHADSQSEKVALVGKGVTFDTGGLSIKGSTNMHYMKSDMGGAAAVLGAMETVAKNQLKRHVIGVVPLAENVIASNAVIPGDIITTYSGKTIEVIDTDAEGRMILADALFYAQEQFNPDIMIDLATLTGSAVRTFGYHCGAIFSKNTALLEKLQSIGTTYGERLWPLPIWDDYQEDLYSDVADLRNLGTLPMAGAITAAKFLENFTNEHPAWTHLDIAGVAFGNTPTSKQKAGTGFGVKLLFEFLRAN